MNQHYCLNVNINNSSSLFSSSHYHRELSRKNCFIYKSLSNKSVDITVIISVLFEFIILQTSFPQINALFIKFNQWLKSNFVFYKLSRKMIISNEFHEKETFPPKYENDMVDALKNKTKNIIRSKTETNIDRNQSWSV